MFINILNTLRYQSIKEKYNINHFLPTTYVGHLAACFDQKIMKME